MITQNHSNEKRSLNFLLCLTPPSPSPLPPALLLALPSFSLSPSFPPLSLLPLSLSHPSLPPSPLSLPSISRCLSPLHLSLSLSPLSLSPLPLSLSPPSLALPHDDWSMSSQYVDLWPFYGYFVYLFLLLLLLLLRLLLLLLILLLLLLNDQIANLFGAFILCKVSNWPLILLRHTWIKTERKGSYQKFFTT